MDGNSLKTSETVRNELKIPDNLRQHTLLIHSNVTVGWWVTAYIMDMVGYVYLLLFRFVSRLLMRRTWELDECTAFFFGCLFICFCLRYCNTCCSKKELQDVSSYGMWQTTVMSRWSVKVYTWTFLVSSWIMVGFRSFFFWFVLEFLGEGTNCSWRQPVYLYFLQLNNDASSFLLFATFPYALFL